MYLIKMSVKESPEEITIRYENAGLLMKLLVLRDDVFWMQNDSGKYTCVKEPVTEDLIIEHLEGKKTIGVPQLSEDGSVVYICYDLDEMDVKTAFRICKAVEKYFGHGIVLEASGSRQSYHIWVVFSQPIAAKFAIMLAKAAVAEIEEKFEIYPKQIRAKYGNFVKLPLGYNRKAKEWSKIVSISSEGNVIEINANVVLKNLEPIDAEEFENAIENAETDMEDQKRKRAKRKKDIQQIQRPYQGDDFPCIRNILEGVEKAKPSRHDAAIVLASYWRNYRMLSHDVTKKLLTEWNSVAVNPPITEDEIESTLKSAEEKGYIFTCGNEKLKPYCPGKENCKDSIPEIIEDMDFTRLYDTWILNYPGLWDDLEAAMSVCCALFLKNLNKPIALILIGPSGSGKSIIVDSLPATGPVSVRVDDFSAACWVTQSRDVQSKDAGSVDFLPKIENKILLTPELSPFLTKDDQSLNQSMGVLTKILDGVGYVRVGGVHGLRGYNKDIKFVWIGASVPFKYGVWKVISNLGPRLYFNAMREAKYEFQDVVNAMTGKPQRERMKECRTATYSYIMMLKKLYGDGFVWDTKKDVEENRDLLKVIYGFADMLTSLRAQLQIWSTAQGDFQWTEPLRETPFKPFESLYTIAQGHALFKGRTNLTKEDLWIVARIALKSAPSDRVKLLMLFLREEDFTLTNREIQLLLGCSAKPMERIMKELVILGLLEKVGDTYKIHSRFDWFSGESYKEILEKIRTFSIAEGVSLTLSAAPTLQGGDKNVFARNE